MRPEFSPWRFFRAGGFDQVRLETAAELLHIGALDQKLWVALSCPVKGIEFDTRTLSLIDADGDGHVRAHDLIAAVDWVATRLSRPEVLEQALPGVPLSAIRQEDETGQNIVAAARTLLADQGATDDMVTVEAASAAQQRFAERAQQAWEAAGAQARPLGDGTEAAYAAWLAVQAKVDDWFARCSLAAFDARAADALNASQESFVALATGALRGDSEAVAALPLARVAADAALPLRQGVNPAWAQRLQALDTLVVQPLLGTQDRLTPAQWQSLGDALAPYAAWLASKPDADAQAAAAQDLERLARLVRDLMRLANNFVAFRDFYDRSTLATFQIGKLYLDGRSCDLCVAVNDPAKHAALASLSRMCLIYLDCVRGTEKMSIAAAMTAGDSDQLIVGRNGVFYDRQGRDWNATITKMLDHPISLRQAFWGPYKRLARMVSEQLQKVAATRAKASEDRLTAAALDVGKKTAAPEPAKPAASAAPAPFDVAKFAGIFAAIGLAVGALGSALAAVLGSLLALKWWQIPFALAGLLLIVSGPAVIMAWFKLRSRNLGPILDANGWAINARARINIPFGTSLTQLAVLPAQAERSLVDPYAEKSGAWKLYLLVLLAGAALLGLWKAGWLPL